MKRYLLSKLCQAVITIILVMLVVFALLRFMPKSGYFSKEQWKEMSDTQKNAYLRNMGVLDPLPLQIKNFVIDLIHGDFGRSITLYPNSPISAVLAEKIPYSLLLNFISWNSVSPPSGIITELLPAVESNLCMSPFLLQQLKSVRTH